MRVAAILAGLVALAPGTAHAADGEVHASWGVIPVLAGNNFLAVVECDALAWPADSNDVPVVTSVACRLDGIEKRAAAPGPLAVTVFEAVTRRTFELCTSAMAVWYEPGTERRYDAVEPWRCTTINL